MDTTLDDYYIEPGDLVMKRGILMPHIVRSSEEKPVVCLVNPTSSYKTFNKKEIIANAYEVDSVLCVNKVSRAASSHSETAERVLGENKVSELSSSHSEKVKKQVQQEKTEQNLQSEETMEEIVAKIPVHLQEVFKSSVEHLDSRQREKLAEVLSNFADVFATIDFDLGNFTAIEHAIDTKDAKSIKQHMRRTPACFVDEEESHLKKMLDAGVIKESVSEWASSPVLIRKRDGSVRWCIDYRALNDVTVKDTFPLTLVEDCLDTLAGNICFSKLDANSAYWQVQVKEDRKKTAFLTKFGLFEHVKMGFWFN